MTLNKKKDYNTLEDIMNVVADFLRAPAPALESSERLHPSPQNFGINRWKPGPRYQLDHQIPFCPIFFETFRTRRIPSKAGIEEWAYYYI